MIRCVWVFVLATVSCAIGNSQTAERLPQTFVIHKRTIVAFFPRVTQADLDSDEDTNEALSDFQFYSGSVRASLQKAGIDFLDADSPSFRVRIGTKIQTFHAGKVLIGYYFTAPGRLPHVEYGVRTDTDLLDAARKYFRIAIQ